MHDGFAIDAFVLTAPLVAFALVALFHFVGCDWILGLNSFDHIVKFSQVAVAGDTTDMADHITSTFSADPARAVGNASLLVVWIFYSSAGAEVAMVSDTAGNSYTGRPRVGQLGPAAADRQRRPPVRDRLARRPLGTPNQF